MIKLKIPGFNLPTRHEKMAEKFKPDLTRVNALGEKYRKMSDDDLRASVLAHRGKEWKELSAVKFEVYAAVREASDRVLGMRHFDVQIVGGLVLLEQAIAEMKTGEGKTLVATLPLVLQGLSGKGAHLVTVNDYLARRDAEWMRPVYEALGLSVGVVVPGMSPEEKREAYAADITYGTNNEFGFDYLRDNMAVESEQLVQRPLNYAIVDEVDSILIDEARTPLIISAPDAESTDLYQKFSKLVPSLKEGPDYNLDEKRKVATLTDEGISRVERMLGMENIYAEGGMRMVHHLEQALRAESLYTKDKDYVVKDGQVIIVDEFTGRLMEGRRYSEGLHQAIEAKERVEVQQESRTLATITFQNFFRLYHQLAGMTGTAVTSAEEFEKVYDLDVAVIPTNKPIRRQDKTDRIYINEVEKYKACVREINKRQQIGQPVLVGTVAIEKSEKLSDELRRAGIKHEVLNAKQHEREAEIISKAGHKGAVTISTNMAGRGTDIKLGDGVSEVGGLFVLGTERHEARRIDNQLRGRSGRQGDPGETQFFVSLEDDVMRVFGGERMKGIMQKLKVPPDEPIENKLVTRALEGAQERVEGYHFDIRKNVLSYDDVLSKQRNSIYTLRRGILVDGIWREVEASEIDLLEKVEELLEEQARELAIAHQPVDGGDWNTKELAENINALTGSDQELIEKQLEKKFDIGAVTEMVSKELLKKWVERREELEETDLRRLVRSASLRAIDVHWMEHLDTMDYLRTGIGLRGYGQRDPLVEYQREGFELFQKLMGTIKAVITETVLKAEIVKTQREEGQAVHAAPKSAIAATKGQPTNASSPTTIKNNPHKAIGRNDPCHCGSGKKFKKCHGVG